MNKRFLVASLAALTTLFAYASSWDAVKIAWSPKAGAEFKYKLKIVTHNIQGQDLKISANVAHKIKEIKTDGNIVVEDKQSGFSVFLGDTDMSAQGIPIPQVITETLTQKANGEVVERKSDAPADMDSPRMDAVSAFNFPDHAVNVGDKWTRTSKGEKAKGTFDTESTFTFAAAEAIGSIQCYKVDVVFKEVNVASGETPITATGSVWVGVDDGEAVRIVMQIKNAEFGHGMPPADSDVNMDRAS